MYSFTINKKAYKIPALASELTLGQFVAISNLKPDDDLGLLNVLIGCDVEMNVHNEKEVASFDREFSNAFKLVDLLEIDISRCLNSGELLIPPNRIEILGLDIDIKPNFMRSMPYWGYVHTREAIKKRMQYGKDEQFNATFEIPGIIAHNLYTLVTRSKYDEAKAEEFKEVVLAANFIQAMQLGNFFLLQQKKLWVSRRKRWRMSLRIWKFRLVSRFLTSMGPRTRSKRSAAEIY